MYNEKVEDSSVSLRINKINLENRRMKVKQKKECTLVQCGSFYLCQIGKS